MKQNKTKHAEKINRVLYTISNTINTVPSFDEMLLSIYVALSEIIDVTNLFIALYDKQEDSLDFVFEVDTIADYSTLPSLKHVSRTASLAYQVIKNGTSLMMNEQQMINFAETMNQELVGPASKIWLGVPLKIQNKAFGVIVVQSYNDPAKYSTVDLDILQLVADHIALVLQRKKAEDALKNSEIRFRKLVENIDEVIFSVDPSGQFSYISPSVKKLTGYSQDDILKSDHSGAPAWFRTVLTGNQKNHNSFDDMILISDRKIVADIIKSAISNHTSYDIEYRIRKKNRKVIWVHEKGNMTGNSDSGVRFEGIIHNIHKRKYAEELNKVLFNITNSVNTTRNLEELFASIHKALSRVLDVTNFFIALYQKDEATLEFPYAVDQKDDYTKIPIQKNIEKTSSLSSLVIQSGKPLLLRGKAMKDHLKATKQVQNTGSPAKCWLGVPLIVKGNIIGVIVTQNYSDFYKYSHNDVDILMSVSDQIALAIERKKTDQALQKSESRFRHLVENIDTTIFSITLDGRFIYISPAIKKFTPFRQETIHGNYYFKNSEIKQDCTKDVFDRKSNKFPGYIHLIHTDHREKVLQRIREAIQNKSYYNVTYKLLSKDGYKWVSERGQYIIDPETGPKIDGVLFDTHDKIHTNLINKTLYQISNAVNTTFNLNELFESIHTSLKNILDVSNFYIALLNKTNDVISFPYDRDIHTSGSDNTTPDFYIHKNECFSITEHIINTKKPLLITGDEINTIRHKTKKEALGTPSAIFMGVPLLIKNNAIGVMATQSYSDPRHFSNKDLELFTSVSEQVAIAIERKMVEEVLRVATKKANAANKAKSEFLANMSHELRTPMNAVMGMTSLMLDTSLDHTQREYSRLIYSNSKSLLKIINNTLDFTKSEAGKLEINNIDFNLKEILTNIEKELLSSLKEKNLGFNYHIDQDVKPRIKGDPERLQQILIILLENSVKFTNKGKISLSVFNESVNNMHCDLKFIIKDTGIGISADNQDKIFQSFTQVDTSSTRKHGGTGLGLTIAKQLVQLMQGEISFNSEEHKGSEFIFTARFQASDLPKKTAKRDLKILIVEDNPVNQKLTALMLKKLNHSSDIAKNGKIAVEILKKSRYDLVFMDIQMPEMDGIEATRIIRDNKSGILQHDIPIIALTAHSMTNDKKTCLNAGMDDYLTKPVKVKNIKAAINRNIKT